VLHRSIIEATSLPRSLKEAAQPLACWNNDQAARSRSRTDEDGLADLIGADPNASGGTAASAVYVLLGSRDSLAGSIDLVATGEGGFKIQGESASDLAGPPWHRRVTSI